MQATQIRAQIQPAIQPCARYEAVETVIARVLRLAGDEVTDALEYRSVAEWDSLAHVNLMFALEETYGMTIDADLVVSLNSVAAIRAHMQQHCREPMDGLTKR